MLVLNWRFYFSSSFQRKLMVNIFSDAANNSCRPPLLHFSELYNEALDHIDLPSDYFRWQDPSLTHHFSYCQYPFILSINAKKHILTKVRPHRAVLYYRPQRN